MEDGSIRHIESQGDVLRNSKGDVENVIVISRDITEREQIERELKKYAKELERSNTELQDFAYIASHDLKAPLRKVRIFGGRLSFSVTMEVFRERLLRMPSPILSAVPEGESFFFP